ncbi:MAG: hypothetical protein JWP36_1729 [Paucimonas sp.]|jgi:hypothetical protein|nr:hypothetical protein [Paucimonas sp.]
MKSAYGVLLALAISSVMAACGGGGDGSSAGSASGTTATGSSTGAGTTGTGIATATGSTSSGTADPGTTGTGGTPSSTPPSTPAPVINSVTAPAEGTRLAGTTVLTIQGENIRNAELLPATGFAPQLGRFAAAADGRSATLSFDSTAVPNGPLTLRISAWNQPAGTAGASETVAMPARTWTFANDPPPAGNDAGRTARCQQMGFASTAPGAGDPVVCITATRTSTPVAQCTAFGTGYGSPEDLLEVLRSGARISKLYCQPGANNGVLNPGCSCLS